MADLSASFGVVLDPWQETVLQAAMGERADGNWAARQVGVSTPRQNGKSQLIVARALAGVLLFGEQTIVVSAHQQDTAREVFGRILDIIESYPALERRVSSVMKAVNREYVRFESGQSIKFKARSTGAGRGFSCDCLLLDEAQILSSAAWSAILPTMSARPNPQAWLLGTPPTEHDDGEVFGRLRALGVEGKASQVAYVEWSADPADDYSAPETWAKANPAFGQRISHEAVQSELETMSAEQFAEERLGIWRQFGHRAVIDRETWTELIGSAPDGVPPDAMAVDIWHDGQISIAGCWMSGEHAHVEEVWAGTQVVAAIAWLMQRAPRRMPLVVDSMSPAASIIPELKSRGHRVIQSSAADMAKACGLVLSRALGNSLSHAGQQSVSAALAGAKKRPIRDAGGWGWDRRRESAVSIAPLVAVTLALFGATTTHRPRSSNAGREAVLL